MVLRASAGVKRRAHAPAAAGGDHGGQVGGRFPHPSPVPWLTGDQVHPLPKPRAHGQQALGPAAGGPGHGFPRGHPV